MYNKVVLKSTSYYNTITKVPYKIPYLALLRRCWRFIFLFFGFFMRLAKKIVNPDFSATSYATNLLLNL